MNDAKCLISVNHPSGIVKAAILEDVRKLKIVDYPEPKVDGNGILMKMEL